MNELNGHDFEDMHVGMTATYAKTITEADIVLFAGASGRQQRDAHQRGVRRDHAVQGPHRAWDAVGKRDLAAIANKLPGPGTIYMKQSLEFRAPVRAGRSPCMRPSPSARCRQRRSASCSRPSVTVRGTVVITGEALVKATSHK
jgi:3-hydroxybutyryl-CoA dehydratase